MKVGDKVRFIGPEYGTSMHGPFLGQLGKVVAMEGYVKMNIEGFVEELVTVQFNGDKKASVVSVKRLQLT